MPPASEAALHRAARELYLTPQRLTPARVAREVIGRCRAEKLPPPSASTVRRRPKALSLAECRRHHEGKPNQNPPCRTHSRLSQSRERLV